MNLAVGGGEHATAAMGRAAVPGGDDAASRLDHGDGGTDVVIVEPGLDHQINLSESQEPIGVAVEPEAGEPDAPGHRLERGALRWCADLGESREKDCL